MKRSRLRRGCAMILGVLALAGSATMLSATSPLDRRDGLAVQLWSFNQKLDGAPSTIPKLDVPAALAQAKALGFTQVETVAVPGYSPRQLRAALDRAGMRAVSALIDYERVRDDLPGAIAEARALGVRQFGIPAIKIFGPAGYNLLTIADTEEAGTALGRACRAAEAAGLRVFLHIHGNELHQLDGRTALDRIIDRAGGCFDIQADIYWIRSSGEDPAAFISRYGTKITSLHLKDWKPPVDMKPVFVPLGQGDLDLPGILAAARAAGVRHYIVEDESGEPRSAISQSLRYLATLGKEGGTRR
jgi:sugar phosphate isomerase/epimerase